MKEVGKLFPLELATMVQSEYSRGITSSLEDHPCNGLVTPQDGPYSISTSVDFASAQHVDICDGSIGIFCWLCMGIPITNGYFLLSNISVIVNEKA